MQISVSALFTVFNLEVNLSSLGSPALHIFFSISFSRGQSARTSDPQSRRRGECGPCRKTPTRWVHLWPFCTKTWQHSIKSSCFFTEAKPLDDTSEIDKVINVELSKISVKTLRAVVPRLRVNAFLKEEEICGKKKGSLFRFLFSPLLSAIFPNVFIFPFFSEKSVGRETWRLSHGCAFQGPQQQRAWLVSWMSFFL